MAKNPSELKESLFSAFFKNDVMEFKRLLLAGGDPNLEGPGGTLLMLAAQSNSTDCLRVLLAHPKIDVNKMRPGYVLHGSNYTALAFAVEGNRLDAVRLLLRHPNIDIPFSGNMRINPDSEDRNHKLIIDTIERKQTDLAAQKSLFRPSVPPSGSSSASSSAAPDTVRKKDKPTTF